MAEGRTSLLRRVLGVVLAHDHVLLQIELIGERAAALARSAAPLAHPIADQCLKRFPRIFILRPAGHRR